MAAVLLVHDDIATIAAVRRLLSRAGHEVVLATSTGDALTAFDHQAPALVILAPSVEGGQGAAFLAELSRHQGGPQARVLLLGEALEGSGAPAVPLPLDGASFLEHVEAVLAAPAPASAAAVAPEEGSLADTLFGDLPPELNRALEQAHDEIEAEAIASIDSSLGARTREDDDELAQLEAEVREEAARRRRARLEHAAAAAQDEPRPPEITHVVSLDELRAEHAARLADRPVDDGDELAELVHARGAGTPRPPPAAEVPPAAEEPLDAVTRAQRAAEEARKKLAALRAERTRDGANIPLESDELFRKKEEARARREAQLQERLKERLRAREAAGLDQDEGPLDFGEVEQAPEPEHENPEEFSAKHGTARGLAAEDEEAPAASELGAGEGPQPDSTEPQGAFAAGEAAGPDFAQDESPQPAYAAEAEDEAAQAPTSDGVGLDADDLFGQTDVPGGAPHDDAGRAQPAHAPVREALDEGHAAAAFAAPAEADRNEATGDPDDPFGLDAMSLEEGTADASSEDDAPASPVVRVKSAPALEDAVFGDRPGGPDDDDGSLGTVRRSARPADAETLGDNAGAGDGPQTATQDDSLDALRASARERARAHGQEHAESVRALKDAAGRLEELGERERLAVEAAERARQMAAAASADARHEAKRLQASEQADRASRARDKAEKERLARQLEAASRGHAEKDRRARELEAQAEDERRERERIAAELAQAREAAATAEARAAQRDRDRGALALTQVDGEVETLPRSGIAAIDRLAEVVRHLAAARVDARLELKHEDAVRVVWLREGSLAGALSSVPGESLIARARQDGLIDPLQMRELLKTYADRPASEQLAALRQHGYIRDAEAIPLVQRHTEAIALEALSAGGALYRLSDQPPPADVLLAASTRPLLGVLVEALRRALEPGPILEAAGGLRAIPVRRQALPPADRVELAERERGLLEAIDGESTVERIILGSGLRQEQALRALVVAKVMGWIDLVQAPELPSGQDAPELELRRLESKLAEVREADYFAVLGLPRSAGRDEVLRAFHVLSGEFNPLRFAAYPDPVVHQQAEQVHAALEEAALALRDDRLRSEYARNLAD